MLLFNFAIMCVVLLGFVLNRNIAHFMAEMEKPWVQLEKLTILYHSKTIDWKQTHNFVPTFVRIYTTIQIISKTLKICKDTSVNNKKLTLVLHEEEKAEFGEDNKDFTNL